MKTLSVFDHFTDQALIAELKALAERERHATARLIAALAEVDGRRLYRGEGCSSMFAYCTRVLRLPEHAAYSRIEAARLARQFPVILELLESGAVNLTTIGLLAPHLTPENHDELLRVATHKSKREVERLAAMLRPQPDVPSSVRKLPAPSEAPIRPSEPGSERAEPVEAPPLVPQVSANIAPSRPAVIAPLAPERYKVQFTVSRETYEKLRRAQDLLRHCIPNGDIAALFDRALTLLLADVERNKLASTERPRSSRNGGATSRHIPAAVKRAVWRRDGGRCVFTGAEGRCEDTGFLEFHHVQPYAAGGKTTADNVELRCRAHNAFEAERFFRHGQPSLLREDTSVYGAVN